MAVKPRVVIAGTDQRQLSDFQDYFVRAGFAVVPVSNGLDCYFAICRAAPCVLVLDADAKLPLGAVEDVVAMIRDDPGIRLVRLVLLTSNSGVSAGKSWRIAEHVVMSKPVDLPVITRVVRALSEFRAHCHGRAFRRPRAKSRRSA